MATDPVCGMQVAEATAKNVSELAGTKYYFCGAGCKRKFDADPAQYLRKQNAAEKSATDLVCGMQVNPATAKNFSEYQGKKYFFCSPGCKTKFEANPQQYLNNPRPAAGAHAGHAHPHVPPKAAATGAIY